MAAGQRLQLTITGIQYPPQAEDNQIEAGEQQPVVITQEVSAEYFCRDGSHYLFYEEQIEGAPQRSKTRIKLKGQVVELNRQEPMGHCMIFESGKPYRTEYATPFGILMLDIITKSVERFSVEECPEGWPGVKIVYTLENEGQAVGEYELVISAGNGSSGHGLHCPS